MNILLVVFGLLLVLALCFSHWVAYDRGERRAARIFHHRYYVPMARNHERLRRKLLDLALADDASLAQQNVALYLQKRRLRFKALQYATKSRYYRRELRRIKGPRDSLLCLVDWFIRYQQGSR